jgi:hypothetical protein
MSSALAVEVSRAIGIEWLLRSLAAGDGCSEAVVARDPFTGGRFRAIASLSATSVDLSRGGVIEASSADAVLTVILEELAAVAELCVVVEDDLRKPGDPVLANRTVRSAYLGDNVLHWSDLRVGVGAEATRMIRLSASGYPLNAFVVKGSARDLGLNDGLPVVEGFETQVAEALTGVVVSAFDTESFLVWDRSGDELRAPDHGEWATRRIGDEGPP